MGRGFAVASLGHGGCAHEACGGGMDVEFGSGEVESVVGWGAARRSVFPPSRTDSEED